MSAGDDTVDTVDAIAADFADRVRRGERPRVSEVLAQHPRHADALATLLPTIAGLEELRQEATPRKPLERLGRYRITREIGRGGMGVVYEAEDAELARRVAVKVLSGEISGDERSLARFQREARLAARLVHPNVVPVHAFGDEDGTRYFAMHLVDGIGLDIVIDAAAVGLVPGSAGDPLVGLVRDQIARKRTRGDRTLHRSPGWRSGACLAIAQAAEALAFAHAQGVLHRDIKPSNLILDQGGHLWVGDFGLAKAREDDPITVTGNIAGTLRYIAPEVFDGKQDGRSDIYSLGLTLFELLTLRPAFSGASRSALIKLVIAGQVDLHVLRETDPGVPAALERIVEVACARRPENRYQDAAHMARDLRAVAAGRAMVTVPVAPRPRPAGVRIAAVAVVMVVLAFLLWPAPATPQPPLRQLAPQVQPAPSPADDPQAAPPGVESPAWPPQATAPEVQPSTLPEPPAAQEVQRPPADPASDAPAPRPEPTWRSQPDLPPRWGDPRDDRPPPGGPPPGGRRLEPRPPPGFGPEPRPPPR